MAATHRDKVLDALSKARVSQITVEFNGYGDSGQVESMTVHPKEKQSVLGEPFGEPREIREWSDGGSRLVTRPQTFREAVEQLCYDILYESHDGWVINEGSFGEFMLYPGEDKIELIYNQRVETYETSEEEY